ncbi:MAG: threonine dehydratase [Terracidiphilus sp.]
MGDDPHLIYPFLMLLPTRDEIRSARALVYRFMPPTPQYTWPLLNQRLGAEAWVKHENHTPTGAFKIRGALIYLSWLKDQHPSLTGVVAATRGNHGQGVGLAASFLGLKAVIVVPHGNSPEKNQAMLAQGVELIQHGHDFQAALEFARALAAERGLEFVESFHPLLVLGTAGYAMEFFESVPPIHTIYVPVGMGSSICGVAAARNALGLDTEIVGVVAELSPSAALSFHHRHVVDAPANTQIADGLACRRPHPDALQVMLANVARFVLVSEAEIASAMLALYRDTHNLAEGAGAASLAAALQQKVQLPGRRIGLVLTGGNVDREVFASVLTAAAHPPANPVEAA